MKAIAEFYDRLDATPEGARVIGTFIAAGGTSEWYYPTCLRQLDGACGDFSEPFRREYGRYLREKYGTEENLRALGEAGLDELRFNLGATNCADRVIENIAAAKEYIPQVGVETPMTKEFWGSFFAKKDLPEQFMQQVNMQV